MILFDHVLLFLTPVKTREFKYYGVFLTIKGEIDISNLFAVLNLGTIFGHNKSAHK